MNKKFSVTKNGKPLDPAFYSWDEKMKTFSSEEDGLVLDFRDFSGCTFKTGSYCTFKTGYYCTFDTGYGCTFDTGSDCTFDTGYGCTFKTGYGCTFDTGSDCTFDTGDKSVIVRHDKFQVIVPEENESIKLCPGNVSGYISKKQGEDAFYMDIDGERIEHVVVDGILSQVVKKRGNVMHVINHGEENVSYIVRDGDKYSHGSTLKEAKDNLMYKLSTRDKSKYEAYTLDTELTLAESIEMYRVITGACEPGTRYFIEQILSPERKADPKPYTVSEVIELTKGQYNHGELVKFFNKG